jgi:hypothetical protein
MQILPNGKNQWIDQNGAPLANGSVYFYAPGTTNPLTTYQDSAGTIPNTNPIQLDSRGQAIVWGSGTFRQVVKDASNVTIWDQIVASAANAADLLASGTSPGAALIGFDGGTLADFFKSKNLRVVNSIAALRACSKLTYASAFVTGYYAAHDGGGGAYTYDAADTSSADNGGTIIVGADGGRWKLCVFDSVSPKQFGAKGDGTTDDSAAFTAALTWCSIAGTRLDIPSTAANYHITTGISSSGAVTVRGSGMSSTRIMFTSNACWTHAGGSLPAFPAYQFHLSGVSLQSGDTLNTSTALLNVSYSSGSNGSTVRAVTIEDVEVCGATLANGFSGGIRLFNATTLKVNRVRVANANTGSGGYTAGSFGLKIDTDSQAGDWYVDQTNVYFCDNGLYVVGEGNNQGFEGMTLTNSLLVANNIGFNLASSVQHLYVRVAGCNINCVSKCISIQNMMWIDIVDNLLYAYDTGVAVPTWVGINFLMNDTNHGLWAANMIRGNVFSGMTTTHATARDGIVYQANPNGLNTQTLIDANTFVNLEYGLVLGSGNNYITFSQTNSLQSVTNPLSDSSGQTNNVLCFDVLGSPGSHGSASGYQQRFASNVPVTLTGGTGTVTFATPFTTSCDLALASNGNPGGGFSTNPVNTVNSSYTKTGFGIQVGGATTGTIYVNYIAIGH